MENWQRSHISANQPQLLKDTVVNTMLLAKLIADGVVSKEDVDFLDSFRISRERTAKFYEMIETRTNSYSLLKQALMETSQSGAYDILNKCNEQNSSTPYKNCGTISYIKEALLGRGSNNTVVYKGMFENRVVAVKIVNIKFVNLNVALREVDLLRQLDWHRNVVRYFRSEISDDCIHIAMELCDTNLHDWVTKAKTVEIEVVDIITQATDGIEHLHAHRIVHGDLKPENILLVSHATGKVLVKITDFGMSKTIPDENSGINVYSSGFGTVGWSAPEVVEHFSNTQMSHSILRVSLASDMFSLGCVYYFTLTGGIHPFGNHIIRRQVNILDGKVELSGEKFLAQLRVNTEDVILLIKQMISPNQQERPSASMVLSRLPGILNSDWKYGNMSSSPDVAAAMKRSDAVAAAVNPDQKNPKLDSDIERNENGNTELHNAVSTNNEELIKELIREGADLDAQNNLLETPLHVAADMKDASVKLIKYLIDEGANVFSKNSKNDTFLHTMLASSNLRFTEIMRKDFIQYLIDKGRGGLFNTPGNVQATPFMLIAGGFITSSETLVIFQRNGVNFNSLNEYGNNVLAFAISAKRSLDYLSKLIDFGVDWKHINKRGRSLLHMSALYGNWFAMEFFIDLGLDVNARDNDGNSPLHVLIRYGKNGMYETASFLIKKGANAGMKNAEGLTPFMLALKNLQTNDKNQVVELLTF